MVQNWHGVPLWIVKWENDLPFLIFENVGKMKPPNHYLDKTLFDIFFDKPTWFGRDDDDSEGMMMIRKEWWWFERNDNDSEGIMMIQKEWWKAGYKSFVSRSLKSTLAQHNIFFEV